MISPLNVMIHRQLTNYQNQTRLQGEAEIHPFYSTDEVIRDLKTYEGWSTGQVVIKDDIQKEVIKTLKSKPSHTLEEAA